MIGDERRRKGLRDLGKGKGGSNIQELPRRDHTTNWSHYKGDRPMRRRHMVVWIESEHDEVPHLPFTLCGHRMSVSEWRWQRKNTWDHVNCKRCLTKKLYDTRDVRSDL